MVYLAGYLACRYHQKNKCAECLTKMCDKNSTLSNKKELLIFNRTFTNVSAAESSRLFAPLANLLCVVEIFIKIYKRLFKKIYAVSRLLKATLEIVSFDSITCPQCKNNSKFVTKHLCKNGFLYTVCTFLYQ